MKSASCRVVAVWLLLGLAIQGSDQNAVGAEPWADERLAERGGLQLWLDASRVAGAETPAGDGLVAVWRDASGKKCDLQQATEAAQPTVLPIGDAAVVRFDGVDDHLRAAVRATELQAFTIFLVAAPRQNLGMFRALMAFNAPNERDYTSGLNVDLGPAPSTAFSELNIEGRGFGGARNLRTGSNPFGRLHTIEIASDGAAVADAAQRTIRLTIDGQPEGARPRAAESLNMAEVTLGARFYNNGAGPQHVDGFGRSDIAEVLVYDRALSADENQSVRDYLTAKYAAVRELLPKFDGGGEPLVLVADPPPVQVFVPGFEVRSLPVELTNINNVRYHADGTLYALGYDGRVWRLLDKDGDGLEELAELFWDNPGGLRATIGMDVTPPGYVRGDGVFVIGKSRCELIVDTDGDGRANDEIEVAGGWKESFHAVDGLGVTIDPRDGSVYYGRGTYNFTDPLLRDKDGVAHYDITDQSAAIIRVTPNFQTREIVATGIRFPVAIRLNRLGDLFATDQEGATWVPNGNPFDELLHIQPGRHYGFPARHPRHLPNVIDEPSTFDYSPQHQSTCGLNLNEPVRPGGPTFGPAGWADDAIVCGYSRGKLYRTQFVKTPAGYVARNHLLACLNMLTVDACVSPAGDLVVACHSGGPDWGTGPTGNGKLYKITYADREHPQPSLVWAAGPRECRVEFNRPVDPRLLREVQSNSRLTAGEFVRAGDRFESLWPGYAVVQLQKASPRYDVPIHSAQLTPDRRTLILATDPMVQAWHYALQLPGMGRPGEQPAGEDAPLPQHAAIDLDFELTGCEATWTPADGSATWNGWLPHVDLQAARKFTRGSASHEALWAAIERPGKLTIRTQLDLTDMLRPAVQPGSQIDYEWPPETVTVTFESSSPVAITAPANADTEAEGREPSGFRDEDPMASSGGSRRSATVSLVREPDAAKRFALELQMEHAGGPIELTASWTTNEDDRPRPLPLRRMFVPWATFDDRPRESATMARPPELAGGSWARGRKEFFGEQAACAKCHRIHGQGGDIGPDLSNLIHRDYASVLRDITQPSFAINPDHLSYNVLLDDGRTLTGVVQSVGERVRVGDAKGVVTELNREQIETMQPSPISTMPEGIPKLLGAERLRDLLTFLLTPPPQMPRDYVGPRPKPRTVAEVQAALAGAPELPSSSSPPRPLRIVLVAGPKDHGPGEHDYPAWQAAWSELLAAADNVEVGTAWEWPTKQDFESSDVIVFYQHGDWDDRRATDVDGFLKRGGGLVYIHWAVDGRQLGRQFAERIGLAALGGVGFRHGELTLQFSTETKHPIIRNFDSLAMTDESYWNMVGSLPADRVLATSVEEGMPRPQLWTIEPQQGRVFVSIPGHYSWTFDDPLFRILLLRGIAWTAREPVDRFNDLVWPGAEIAR